MHSNRSALLPAGGKLGVRSQPLNAESGEVKGIEISYTNSDFNLPGILQGLGMIANFTWLDGSYNLPMAAAAIAQGEPEIRETWGQINQPRYIANVAMTYKRGPLGAVVSFNRTGTRLRSANSSATIQDAYYLPRNQFDASLRYDLTPWATLSVQAQNFTNSSFDARIGPGHKYRQTSSTSGANYWMGLSLKF